MRVAVIGGGVNGLCCAWQLAAAGCQVELYERDGLMMATSRASSKLLHGGLRYLEQGELRLVREALHERQWWLHHVPRWTRRLRILWPLYRGNRVPRWRLKAGLWLYDRLAGGRGIGGHYWLSPKQVLRRSPHLISDRLLGAYMFFDGQMDDYRLGLWVAEQCRALGVALHEQQTVQKVSRDGGLQVDGHWQHYNYVVNAAGPWSEQLLRASDLTPAQPLDLVRGSHLVIPRISRYGHMLEVPGEPRFVFVLPQADHMLLGTTEVRQQADDPIQISAAERDYLLQVYNSYFQPGCDARSVLDSFAGVRPLLAGSESATRASREYRLDWQDRLLTVAGGKWTTARALGLRVARELLAR